jgi:hypothetical protein
VIRISQFILIRGPMDRVFDLVTTARYWPEWHPATLSVGGAVETPMQLGDSIHERARIGGTIGENDWAVVEHARPSRVVLRMPGTRLGDLEIVYRFAARGDAVEFTRELEFDLANLPANVDKRAIERQMETDSAEALRRLKSLIERLLV